MLQFTDDAKPLTRAARAALMGAVVAIGLSVSAVRGPAEPPAASAPAVDRNRLRARLSAGKGQRVHRHSAAWLLGRPDMKPCLRLPPPRSVQCSRCVGLPANAISLDDIEQVVGPIELKTLPEEERKKMPNGEGHSISMGIVFIRMKVDFDWPALLAIDAEMDVGDRQRKRDFSKFARPYSGRNR